ncbi:OPT oligopeptide transporter protein-domain-containing protein [Fusarium avenaceum]|nr:OPT oligopeptide transporter protein-domain-containing protein [Fusarium avenaceum]
MESCTVGESEEDDKFRPLSGVEPYSGDRILTVRAVVTGIILGSVILCANVYLGLKAGFGVDATLFSGIFGFIICKGLENSNLPLVSGHFGPHENNIIQATALGCIGIGFMFISGVPALYQLKLLNNPTSDLGTLICLSLVAGFWGLGFAAPFRSIFILRLARQLSLVFPYGTASAVTIRALHATTRGGQNTREMKDNTRGILISFSVFTVWAVATSYAPGILYTWNPFWWIYKWGGTNIISAVNWGWLSWSWAPSILGTGMLIDLNAAFSFLLGAVLAWGIIGPIIVSTGVAVGIPYNPEYPDLITYNAFIPEQFVSMPSPRYWILWPAVFMLLGVSVTLILLESKSMVSFVRYGAQRALYAVRSSGHIQHDGSVATVQRPPALAEAIEDPTPPNLRVRQWEWMTVTSITFIIALVSMKYLMGVPPHIGLLNLVLGFFWSFVVIHTMGTAGISPTSTVAKGSQFITGAATKDMARTNLDMAYGSNLTGALVVGAATQQSSELCQDFRTGFLLGTPPRAQWHAQMLGTLSSVILAPCLFVAFTKAFPCINDASQAATCQFAMPSATSWRIITEAIFMPEFPISKSSWIFSIVLTVVGIGATAFKRWLQQHPKHKALEVWIPNMSLVGLAMVIPGSNTMLTMAMGAFGAVLWKRFHPETHARFLYPVAAGGIAGEGIGFVIQAALQIASVGGPLYYGTSIGCVGDQC